MRTLALMLLIALSIAPVYGGSGFNAMQQKREECDELSSYGRLAGCFHGLYQESDALLNKEYQKLFNYLGEEHPDGANRKRLVEAQRIWIKFRDSDCLFADPGGEPGREAISEANRAACLADRTIERLKHLEDYNNFSRGCNGCPW